MKLCPFRKAFYGIIITQKMQNIKDRQIFTFLFYKIILKL
jgi:hypothetical protein